MKVYLANASQQKVGGGWSFLANFRKGMGDLITEDYDAATIYFISGATMVGRDEVQKAKDDGKKVVLRIDNAVRNSRNRNTGMSRMRDFAQWADLVVYQSRWAREYLEPFLQKTGPVILNGTDMELFTDEGRVENHDVLYSRFNRDETKNWEVARYWYSQYQLLNPDAKLIIVGQFSDELKQGNFDFYNNERFEYYGVLDARAMAKLYRACGNFLYTYYNDACSQSLIEALVSGCNIVGDVYYRTTGGAGEIIDNFELEGREHFSLHRMCNDYRQLMEAL